MSNEFTPPPVDIQAEIKKAIGLRRDGTYSTDDLFISHLFQIINDASKDGARDKDQLERMLHKYTELRHKQSMYFKSSFKQSTTAKALLKECKELEKELDKKAAGLLKLGYNIDRFQTPTIKQGKIL